MKKIIFNLIIAAFVFTVGFHGCKKDPEPDLDTSSKLLSFTATSESKIFEVTSNVEWSISSFADWLTVTPDKGKGNGKVTVTAQTNETTTIRPTELTITAKDAKDVKLNVLQDAKQVVAPDPPTMQIIMTTAESSGIPIHIVLFGSGEATIDWGDGTSETITIKYDQPQPLFYPPLFEHSYSESSSHAIIITGKNITGLECTWKGVVTQLPPHIPITSIYISENTVFKELSCERNQLTSLNVSTNSVLTTLRCSGNQLTNLNVSGLNELLYLYCERNFMDAAALNVLFKSLNSIPTPSSASMYKQIWIGWNGSNYDGSGTEECDPSIAIEKKWNVVYI